VAVDIGMTKFCLTCGSHNVLPQHHAVLSATHVRRDQNCDVCRRMCSKSFANARAYLDIWGCLRISGGVCASSPLLSHRLQNCQSVASAANKAQITKLATRQSGFPSSHLKSPVRGVNTTCVVVKAQNTEWQATISLRNRKLLEGRPDAESRSPQGDLT
jgi:hypothetical protein